MTWYRSWSVFVSERWLLQEIARRLFYQHAILWRGYRIGQIRFAASPMMFSDQPFSMPATESNLDGISETSWWEPWMRQSRSATRAKNSGSRMMTCPGNFVPKES